MIKYKKHLGQHFLKDQNILKKIVKSIKPSKKDYFLEIGPGDGALSSCLYDKVYELLLVEKDMQLIPMLKEKYKEENNIKIYNRDILKLEIDKITKKKLRIIGNLPYNISTEIIFKMLSYTKNLIDLHFMLQKEVVDRIVAKPCSKSYGRLSVMTQVYFKTKRLFNISPNVFIPKPKVYSSYLHLVPKKYPFDSKKHENQFNSIVKILFTARRKMIKTSLKNIIDESGLTGLNIDPKSRPELLNLDNFLDISRNV